MNHSPLEPVGDRVYLMTFLPNILKPGGTSGMPFDYSKHREATLIFIRTSSGLRSLNSLIRYATREVIGTNFLLEGVSAEAGFPTKSSNFSASAMEFPSRVTYDTCFSQTTT